MTKVCPGLDAGEKEPLAPPEEQGGTLLKTKLFIPPIRSNQIARARLVDLLNAGLEKTLILVSAPAGYGKTTLVSNWLSATGIPSAWLSLDAGDNDPVRFLQYLLSAFDRIAPGMGEYLPGILQGMHPSQYEDVIQLLVNELSSMAGPRVLVLDDFHVIQSQTILKMLGFLLEHLPPQMHMVVVTRTDPALPLARLRARNQLEDIRADRLRFQLDEIAAFLNDAMGLALSGGDLAAMERRTEGWIAGLQLAALSMKSSRDIHAFVSAFTGSHHYIMDYLVEEVLKQQPEQVGTFLLQTSLLERLCGPLCEAVAGAGSARPVHGQAMLEQLEEMNLFVIPLDDDRRWYRYHHLFADVLRKRLEHQFPDSLPGLHRSASVWYEQNGFIAESIQQAIAAGDQARAAGLIEQNGCLLLISGEVSTLLGWTDAIEFQSDAHPWLAIQKAWALALTGDLERVEPTLQAPEHMLSSLEPSIEVRTMLGTIAAARANCANSRGDTQSSAEYARQALELLPDCDSLSRSIRSVTTSILGDASWINGDLEAAGLAYTGAIHIGREAGNRHMVIIASSNLAGILVEQGQIQRASDLYLQAYQMAVRPDGQRSALAGSLCEGLGRLSYARNQLDEAGRSIQECLDLCRQWRDDGLQAAAWAMRSRIEQARGNPEAARAAMRAAEQSAGDQALSPGRSAQVWSDLGRVWLAQGNLDRLAKFIQKSGLAVDDEIPYPREPEYLLLLRALLASGDFEAVLLLAGRLLHQAESTGRMGVVIEVLVLQALAYQGQKDTENALKSLERSLALAQPEGLVRVFLDEGEAMTRLLCQVQARQVGNGYAADLLSRIGRIASMTPPSMQLLIEPLTGRELEVFRLIEAGYSNQEISEKLVISLTTVKRHISNIYAKLGVNSRTQAVAIGKELKIFE